MEPLPFRFSSPRPSALPLEEKLNLRTPAVLKSLSGFSVVIPALKMNVVMPGTSFAMNFLSKKVFVVIPPPAVNPLKVNVLPGCNPCAVSVVTVAIPTASVKSTVAIPTLGEEIYARGLLTSFLSGKVTPRPTDPLFSRTIEDVDGISLISKMSLKASSGNPVSSIASPMLLLIAVTSTTAETLGAPAGDAETVIVLPIAYAPPAETIETELTVFAAETSARTAALEPTIRLLESSVEYRVVESPVLLLYPAPSVIMDSSLIEFRVCSVSRKIVRVVLPAPETTPPVIA